MKNGWRTTIERKQLLHFYIHFESFDSIIVVQFRNVASIKMLKLNAFMFQKIKEPWEKTT